MTNYTKTTDFAAKDSLPSGNAAKIVKGSEIDTEFNNIATASATKANANDAALTGTTTAQTLDISGNVDVDGTLETDALSINGVTVTSTAAELNILDGVTSTAAELNILDGVTSTTAELNILDGVTSTTAELNILDGVTATTAELNYVDGVTSNVQTQLNTKAPLASPTFTGTVTAAGLTVDTTTLVVDASNNRVGIGTSSPTGGVLHIAHGNELGIFTSGPYNYQAKFESTDSEAAIIIEDNASTTDGNRIGVIGDNMAFTTANAERMRIDSSGNLLAGTTSSTNAGKVRIQGATADAADSTVLTLHQNNLNVGGASLIKIGTEAANFAKSAIGFKRTDAYDRGAIIFCQENTGDQSDVDSSDEVMRIDASGNVGIGETSPHSFGANQSGLTISDGTGGCIRLKNDAGTANFDIENGGGTGTNLNSVNAFPLKFSTSNTERMRIDASGNLLIGSTNNSNESDEGFKLKPNGEGTNKPRLSISTAGYQTETCLSIYSTAVTAFRFFVDAAGTISAVNTTISSISDERVKENVRDLDDGLDKVLQLQPRKFDWKQGQGRDISNDRGFIAQEFEQVFPDMIEEWKDEAPEGEEPYKAINANLIPTLVKAIQEQQETITALEARITQLENS